jgi:RimJ/RimL family protein N-acetyltransferase
VGTVTAFVLRDWGPADRRAFVELLTDPEVVRFVGDGTADPVMVEAVFDRAMALELGPTHRFAFVHAVVVDAEVVGHVELKVTEDCGPDEWEVVYILARRAWGRGLGGALVAWASETCRAHGRRMVATVHPDNAASLCLLGRAGLREVERRPPDTVVLRQP